MPSKQGGPSEVSDTERDLQKVLSAERGFSPAVWQRSAELMQDVCEWQVEFRGKSRSLWEELQRVGVTDLSLRCFLLPLIALTEERMSDADGAHVEIKRLTRLQTEVGGARHIEFLRLLQEAPDAVAQLQQLAPNLYADLSAGANRDAKHSRGRFTKQQFRAYPALQELRVKVKNAQRSLTPLTEHLCDVMAAVTASRYKEPKRHHRLVGQLLVACGLVDNVDPSDVTRRVKQRDQRSRSAQEATPG